MNNAYGLTKENLLNALPAVLQQDEKMQALADSIAGVLAARPAEIDAVRIYSAIDKQPEEVLDIIAKDFKIDWYNYDYPLDAKRALVKTAPYVHKHLGTKGAVVAAIRSIYPQSTVEEWFEYDGNPFEFRVLIDMQEPSIPVSNEELLWAVAYYKSLRSHCEGVFYRSEYNLCVECSCGYYPFKSRLCGTFPVRATKGAIFDYPLALETDASGVAYTMPRTGVPDTGTFPRAAVIGSIGELDLGVVTAANGVTYTAPKTGQQTAGRHPDAAVQGSIQGTGLYTEATGQGVSYKAKLCGRKPGSFM